MSEQHKPTHEQGEKLKPLEATSEALKQKMEKETSPEDAGHGKQEHVEAHRDKVEQHAVAGKEFSPAENEATGQHPVLVNKHLKDMAFSRALTRARKKLSAPSRAFSKVIHVPAVDKASEAAGKTIARPAGLLWGSILAFLGTSALLWITRHYGYEYNYLAVILLFVIGLVIGNVAEGLWYVFRSKRQ